MFKIAVTGVGGGVGQSILKALNMWEYEHEVWAIDCAETAGLYMPYADRRWWNKELNLKGTHFLPQAWWDVLLRNEIDVLIPGSDYDLPAFSIARDALWAAGCKVMVSDYDLVMTCDNKRMTCQRLEYLNLPHPRFDEQVNEFPCFVKPIGGLLRPLPRVR